VKHLLSNEEKADSSASPQNDIVSQRNHFLFPRQHGLNSIFDRSTYDMSGEFFVLFVSFVVSNPYSSTNETSDLTPLRFNSSKNIG
jgi:hypothetical protein